VRCKVQWLLIVPSVRKFINGNVNLNYDIVLDDKGKQLTVQFDYLGYNSDMDQQLLTKSYLPGVMC
jgi:hypothetical protein